MCLKTQNKIPQDYIGKKCFNCSEWGVHTSEDNCNYVSLDETTDVTSSATDLMFIQLNIRGLISKQCKISKLINNCIKLSKIEVVILCETWVTATKKPLIHVPGYSYMSTERERIRKGSSWFSHC